MRVQDATGAPSQYLSVLQVQTIITHTDSFFLQGVPFTAPLLLLFNVTQGQKDTIYEQNYYRLGEVTPLAQVEFHDAAFTQPYKATTHIQRLQAVGVPNVINEPDVKVYPNPATEGYVFVETTLNGSLSYELINISGQSVAEGVIKPVGGQPHAIQLPSVTPGIYFIRILNDNKEVAIRPLEIK
jgi:hypothetical protein